MGAFGYLYAYPWVQSMMGRLAALWPPYENVAVYDPDFIIGKDLNPSEDCTLIMPAGSGELRPNYAGGLFAGDGVAYATMPELIVNTSEIFEIEIRFKIIELVVLNAFLGGLTANNHCYFTDAGVFFLKTDAIGGSIAGAISASDDWQILKIIGTGTTTVEINTNGIDKGDITIGSIFSLERLLSYGVAGNFPFSGDLDYIKITSNNLTVAHWLFESSNQPGTNGPNTVTDISGNGNHATYVNLDPSVNFGRTSEFASVLNQTGYNNPSYVSTADYINLPHAVPIGSSDDFEFTFEFYFIPDASTYHYIFGNNDTDINAIQAIDINISSKLRIRFINSAIYETVATITNIGLYTIIVKRVSGSLEMSINGSNEVVDTGNIDTFNSNICYLGTRNFSGFDYGLTGGFYSAKFVVAGITLGDHSMADINAMDGVHEALPIPAQLTDPTLDAFGVALLYTGKSNLYSELHSFPVPEFDELAYINFGSIDAINNIGTGDFTVGATIKGISSASSSVIFGKGVVAGHKGFEFFQSVGKIVFLTRGNSDKKVETVKDTYSGIHSIICGVDSGVTFIETDEETLITGETVDGSLADVDDTIIGADSDGNFELADGSVWAVFVLNRLMTTEERETYKCCQAIPTDGKIFHAPCTDYLNSYLTDIVSGTKGVITNYDESLFWAGRSKMAWWNLIKGFEQTPVTFAEQPANDAGSIPGLNIAVSNPSKCNPFVPIPFLATMLNFEYVENLINMLTMM